MPGYVLYDRCKSRCGISDANHAGLSRKACLQGLVLYLMDIMERSFKNIHLLQGDTRGRPGRVADRSVSAKIMTFRNIFQLLERSCP